jgi:ferredoxin-NADP reductase
MPLDISASIPFPKPAVPNFKIDAHRLTLVQKLRETADIYSFTFKVEGRGIKHLPGQAVMVELPMPDGPETRMFTVCSSGLDRSHITLTVKAAPDAFATRWMHDSLEVGSEISARGPFGHFTVANTPNKDVVLIGGGSGFTPAMSMLRWLHKRGEDTPVTVIQTARTVADLLFREELAQIAQDMPNLRLFLIPSQVAAGESWTGYRGLVDRAMVRTMVPSLHKAVAFCCGPQGFMDHIQRVLCAEGLPRDDYFTETFGPKTAPATKPTSEIQPAKDGKTATITFKDKSVPVIAGEPLSKTLADAHLRVPTACGVGMCGTCKVQLGEGSVEMHDAGGLSQKEKDRGLILSCCSYANGPVKIAPADP